jgi:hypothetical protein
VRDELTAIYRMLEKQNSISLVTRRARYTKIPARFFVWIHTDMWGDGDRGAQAQSTTLPSTAFSVVSNKKRWSQRLRVYSRRILRGIWTRDCFKSNKIEEIVSITCPFISGGINCTKLHSEEHNVTIIHLFVRFSLHVRRTPPSQLSSLECFRRVVVGLRIAKSTSIPFL